MGLSPQRHPDYGLVRAPAGQFSGGDLNDPPPPPAFRHPPRRSWPPRRSLSAPTPSPPSTGSSAKANVEVNFQLSRAATLPRRRRPKFEELTGIKVGFEQIPEQQQRPKVAMEMASGHPSFDVVNVGMHVQKSLVERRAGCKIFGPISLIMS